MCFPLKPKWVECLSIIFVRIDEIFTIFLQGEYDYLLVRIYVDEG